MTHQPHPATPLAGFYLMTTRVTPRCDRGPIDPHQPLRAPALDPEPQRQTLHAQVNAHFTKTPPKL